MRNTVIIFLTFAFILFIKACRSENSDTKNNASLIEDNLYFGYQAPDLTPEIFDYKPLSEEDWQLGSVFTPEKEEFYFSNSRGGPFTPTVIVYRRENNVWKKYNFHSAFSGDSNILYDKAKYIEKTDSGWSKIKSLGPMFDREDWGIMRLTSSTMGTYVFDDAKNNDVIRMSSIKDGKREEPKLLGKEINTGKWTAHPFIAPDESYLIWDSEREEGYGGADIYISFRQQDGSWGAAINLGAKINTPLWENAAMVTHDGEYLGFSRSEEKVKEDGSTYWTGDKYWVSMTVIEELRPQ